MKRRGFMGLFGAGLLASRASGTPSKTTRKVPFSHILVFLNGTKLSQADADFPDFRWEFAARPNGYFVKVEHQSTRRDDRLEIVNLTTANQFLIILTEHKGRGEPIGVIPVEFMQDHR